MRINLDHYVLGPNITYGYINESDHHPTRWIDKVNHTHINFKGEPIKDIIFYHTDVIPSLGHSNVIYYVQDYTKKTYVFDCLHVAEENNMNCTELASFAHESEIVAFTTAFYLDDKLNYFYIMVFQNNLKSIHIYGYNNEHKLEYVINYDGHYESEVTSLAYSNGFLYVLRAHEKSIDVYRLAECKQ